MSDVEKVVLYGCYLKMFGVFLVISCAKRICVVAVSCVFNLFIFDRYELREVDESVFFVVVLF